MKKTVAYKQQYLYKRERSASIFKFFKNHRNWFPGIDSQESIPPAFV